MINQERLVNTLIDLVKLDSETKFERKVADYAKAKLESLGFSVREDEAGEKIGGNAGNVIGYHPGDGQGKSLLFCAHMDTVKPGIGVKPQIRDGVIYSSGDTILGGDDKAGMAAIFEAIETAQENNIPCGPIQVVFTVAEEGGLLGAKQLEVEKMQPVDAAFSFDSDGMPSDICVAAPHHIAITVTFTGKAVHSGMEPEKGINAIYMMAEAIHNMKLGRIDEETTANFGVVNGGRATNIVTESVTIWGEARSLNKEKVDAQIAHMTKCCEEAAAKFGGKVEVITEEEYSAINLDKDSVIVQMASQAAEKLGLTPNLVKSGGGTDANVFCGKGIPACNIGVGMENVHSMEECLSIEKMAMASKVILELIKAAK
ncbi:MAG: M20/M25/M40 family metallo-hydrolase [Peptococcaceae bacterium]|nr:M20/M25/M40 family metallo-hydrolase [Peptococcaceae bacterium]